MDANNWHSLSVEEALKRLDTGTAGLTSAEVAARQSRFGRNEIQRGKQIPPFRLFLKQFANFFIIVLMFAAALAYAVSFLPGEHDRRLTAFFILFIIAVSVALSFFEEFRAQKELESLDRLLSFKATVLRDGIRHLSDTSEVVPGDILVLSQGRKVPADARVIDAHGLRTDESALTGESIGVDKSSDPVAADSPLAEHYSMVFGSTFITHGTGLAVAVRTGMSTEVGRIAAELERMEERPTPFQTEVRKMARQMTVIVGVLAAVVAVILYFLLHYPLVDVALNTLSLAVATIPESLPIVLTFALALGAHQMAARKAVVRRLSVVESLGSVDTICTDKTGTLTQNLMEIQRLYADGRTVAFGRGLMEEGSLYQLLQAGVLCNEAFVEDIPDFRAVGDPVDSAMLRAAHAAGLDVERERAEWRKVGEVPFSSERKMMTTVHSRANRLVACSKGAPEAVLSRCTTVMEKGRIAVMDGPCRNTMQRELESMQGEALYVLALARKDMADSNENPEEDMTFIGLMAMRDPPRPEVGEAIEQAGEAGIRIVMITGDNARTARAVGGQIGIGEHCVESSELEGISRRELRESMKGIDIIARATPQTKQHVLQALQDEGHFTAMTGDGVNDATALKQSDVGVAMGLRGTDIAKESAAMVLLDDNFATILAAVEEGRRIFDNIRKFTNYLLSTSLGEVFVVLGLSAAGYFPLSPIMLLWVNVVTDLVPAGALAADPAVPHVMKRRPRRHDEPILNRAIYATIAGSVFRTIIAYALIFWVGLRLGNLTYARTMLFTSIVLHAFTRVMVVRQLDSLSIWSNRALLWSYAAAVGLQMLALYTPLRKLFGVVPLDWRAWAVMAPVVALSSAWGVYMTRWILKYIPMWEE
jgi:Ca2+-transporting ATPase